jgi:hypothetical protein
VYFKETRDRDAVFSAKYKYDISSMPPVFMVKLKYPLLEAVYNLAFENDFILTGFFFGKERASS